MDTLIVIIAENVSVSHYILCYYSNPIIPVNVESFISIGRSLLCIDVLNHLTVSVTLTAQRRKCLLGGKRIINI